MSENLKLNTREDERRKLILNGNVFVVLIKLGMPIALFQLLNQLFRLFDTFMAAGISSEAASMVAYFSQMNLVLASVGSGLAIGTALKIGLAYGSGNFEQVRKTISTMVALVALIAMVLAVIIIPAATPFLRFINAPSDFITYGRYFFIIEFLTTLILFFNMIYISIEKAQGNSRRILSLNLISMIIKLSLTAAGVYIFNAGITFLAISTMISQTLIMIIGLNNLLGKKSEVFRFSKVHIAFNKETLRPIIYASLPIIFSHMIFNLGKTIINTMLISYGALVVGASGIGSLLAGAATMLQFGLQDAAVAVMTQNRGAKKFKRIYQTYKGLITINTISTLVLFLPLWILGSHITRLFALGDPEFHSILYPIYRFMILNMWSFIILTSSNALFLAFGFTKILSFISLSTLFLFRIPLLWLFENFTNVGSEVAGLVMMYSNFLTIIPTLIFLYIALKKIKKEELIASSAE